MQFYMNFKQPIRPACFKRYDSAIHFTKVTRTEDDAAAYCMKEDTRVSGPFTFGVLPVRRCSKTDWQLVFDNAKVGDFSKTPPDIMVKCYGNLRKIEKDFMKIEDTLTEPRGVWIHGPSGVGKSTYARDHYPSHYPKLCNKWWDGFQG